MKKIAKLLALLLVLVMVVGMFAGCGQKEEAPKADDTKKEETPKADDTKKEETKKDDKPAEPAKSDRPLNIAISSDTGTLNPLSSTGDFVNVMYAFYEPLWDYTRTGERIWLLATDWERVTDTQYKLTIREGVKFHNGGDLNAEDVWFSMQLARDDARHYLDVKVIDFDKTCITGDYTMDVYYTAYDITQEYSLMQMMIFDKETYNAEELSSKPNGTGPYIVKDYVVNSQLTCVPNENYWGDAPKINTINFKVMKDPSQVVNALEVNDIDIARVVPIDELDYIEDLGYICDTTWSNYCHQTYFSFANNLASKDARWAICYAMDREAMQQVMYNGISACPRYPASEHMSDYEERFDNLADYYVTGYNLDKAKEYAEKAGLIGKTLKIITNGDALYNNAALVLQNSLKEIGIDSTITPLDNATYFSVLGDESQYDIAFHYAPGTFTVDVMANYPDFVPMGWTGDLRTQYGELAHKAAQTYDPKTRSDLLYDALKIFTDEAPWMPVCEGVGLSATSPDLAGVSYRRLGTLNYTEAYFAN